MDALGWVPVEGRGSLPFALVHGESLVAAASWALEQAGVSLIDFDTDPADVRAAGLPLVLHDPLCPLTPPEFLTEALELAVAEDCVVVGCRPVTDTVKPLEGDLEGGVLGDTVDRDGLVRVTSPVVLPARVLAGLTTLATDDFADLVATLAQEHDVRMLPAPALGGRVEDESGLRPLEALSEG